MRKPSPATEIRNLKREVAMLRSDVARWKKNAMEFSQRAHLADQALIEWKRRFDALLKIVPGTSPTGDRETTK